MPVYSMTGYASVQSSTPASESGTDTAATAAVRFGLEIRSVNSRFLDLSFRLPDELRHTEPALREHITQHIKRGKVEVRAVYHSTQDNDLADPSIGTLQKLVGLQNKIQSWLPNARDLSVSDVIKLASHEKSGAGLQDADLMPLATQAVKALKDARAREGARLAEMLQDRIGQLRTLAEQAAPLLPQLVEQQRQRFIDRWNEAMALSDGNVSSDVAKDRALTEATAFAIRIDVAEELTRLASHLDEISRLVKKGGDIGKRLDFLIQELHREANTLGSKSAALELTKISVDMKVLIEQMREQVQNIE
ncbi:YicC/YloC family endoribonuclease [Limnohabitans sp. Hippo4]|uniref:YicC/YloC family endoribonuclease n=1 Tax=Limnohabitans sp. Hippo4 TaxID=1826167 RepID=UPI000D3870E4|nr:YicC/YloC family endoribonuclease [Limnohabitans sp. Hippo4]MBU3723105.1 YicC family protein [Limnohabitans sp.]PUE37828.1 YicC family protein [Limnohabitans sp. Hippo4]